MAVITLVQRYVVVAFDMGRFIVVGNHITLDRARETKRYHEDKGCCACIVINKGGLLYTPRIIEQTGQYGDDFDEANM